jgi:hypothetical protein
MPVKKPKLEPEVEAFYTQLLKEGGLSEKETDLIHELLGNDKITRVFKSGVHAQATLNKEREASTLTRRTITERTRP